MSGRAFKSNYKHNGGKHASYSNSNTTILTHVGSNGKVVFNGEGPVEWACCQEAIKRVFVLTNGSWELVKRPDPLPPGYSVETCEETTFSEPEPTFAERVTAKVNADLAIAATQLAENLQGIDDCAAEEHGISPANVAAQKMAARAKNRDIVA